MEDRAFQQCIIPACGARYDLGEVLFSCRRCGALLDVAYDWSGCAPPTSLSFFDSRRALSQPGSPGDAGGVWRFRELLPFAKQEDLVTIGEGRTQLQQADELAVAVGHKPGCLFLQYEGFNPSGSFKDNGMAAAFTMARRLGRRRVGCASTGNTSASMSLFAGLTKTGDGESMQAVVFVGGGKIALAKLAQALDYGAKTLQIEGDFDACMKLVQTCVDRLGLYLMNSVNPFRLEGQKTIIYRVLEGLRWQVPEWVVLPGGNLGNTSAFGKALCELRELGLIDRLPRLAVINAQGANTLYELDERQGFRFHNGSFDPGRVESFYQRQDAKGQAAKTVASAIEIGRPVNLPKALRSLDATKGVVRQVSDEAILDGKALVGRYGFGCEPASGASIAGLRLLLKERVICPSDRVVCILTGHSLKDPTVTVDYHTSTESEETATSLANAPIRVLADVDAIAKVLET